MILLVGAGTMAQEYAKVLLALGYAFDVVGRSQESADSFEQVHKITPFVGGLDKFYQDNKSNCYTSAIVTTGVEQLAETSRLLIAKGLKNILVEKPAGINFSEIEALSQFSLAQQADVFVAYNRRFFSSVLKAQEIIEQDGGVQSFNFEVTEWGHVIAGSSNTAGVKDNWFMANTTHVVDLAFFLGGFPKQINSFSNGGNQWHSRSSNFAGAGISELDALFAYHGNWQSAGRWSVEVLTSKHRLILRPMEQLQIQNLGSIDLTKVDTDDQIDQNFKAGLYRQVQAFLLGDKRNLCTLAEQAKNAKIYNEIAGY